MEDYSIRVPDIFMFMKTFHSPLYLKLLALNLANLLKKEELLGEPKLLDFLDQNGFKVMSINSIEALLYSYYENNP